MIIIPKVIFKALNFIENMQLIAMLINDEKKSTNQNNTNYFKNTFKEISSVDFNEMNYEKILKTLETKLFDEWQERMKNINTIIHDFQSNWDLINDEVIKDLEKKLSIKWKLDISIIEAKVGILYACPRNIKEQKFFTTIYGGTKWMREVAIHELCHFIFFTKWQELFNDYNYKNYDSPSILWYLSEAIIDPLLNNETFNKYIDKNLLAYNYFYKLKINNISIIDQLRNIIKDNNIEDAIKESYQYFIDNEEIIKRGAK